MMGLYAPVMLKTTLFFLLATVTAAWASFGSAGPVSAQAPTPSNDPWSWCNFHYYSQPVDEEECEEELATTIPPPTVTLFPNTYPSPTVVPYSPLRPLLEQHALLTAYYLMAYYDKRIDAQYWQQTLDANIQALGTEVGAAYGQNAQTGFVRLLQQQTTLLTQYIDSVHTGSQSSIGIAKAELNDNIGYEAAFFQNQNHPASDLRGLFSQYVNDETSIVDNYNLGNQQAVADLLGQSRAHTDMIADAISGPSGRLVPTVQTP